MVTGKKTEIKHESNPQEPENELTIESGNEEEIIDATPISYCFPGTTTIFVTAEDTKEHESKRNPELNQVNEQLEQQEKVQRKRKRTVVERPSVTLEERKVGWAVDSRTHIDQRRRDKVFYHVQTQVQCRSLMEVYRFIKYNISPKDVKEIKNEKEFQEDGSIKKQKLKANKLLKPEVVGSYNFKTSQICKHENKSQQEIAIDLKIDKEVEPISTALEGKNVSMDVDSKTNEASGETHGTKIDEAKPEYIGLYVNYELN